MFYFLILSGVHGIFHTASPVNFALDKYEETVIPAEKGSETLLESALKAGPQLASVVVTSSAVAVVDPKEKPGYVFTESDFASVRLAQAIKDKEEGVKTPGGVLYAASKTAAERAVWKFRDQHKPNFAITTINPSVVVGPPVVLPASSSQLNETLVPIFKILSGEAKAIPPPIGTGSFVDVRDVVFMHTWALENLSKADGERYIACKGLGPPQAVADILREKYEGTNIGGKIPVGSPGDGYLGFDKEAGVVRDVVYPPGKDQVSGKKAEKEMGFIYIGYKQSIKDTVDVLEKLL